MGPDLGFLRAPLGAAKESLEAGDSRLTALDDLAKKSAWVDLAARVDELIAAGIYDVRPLSYYLFAAFLGGGLAELAVVVESARALVTDQFDVVGPTKKHAEQFDRRLAWLFEQITSSIRYHEQKKTPEWATWSEASSAQITGALAAATDLEPLLAAGSFAGASRGLGGLMDWLRGRAEALLAAPEAEPAGAKGSPESKAEPPVPTAAVVPGEPPRQTVTLSASHHFFELASKLRAFETLMEKKQFAKAAVVADDVMQRLDQFDPREYFPELVAPFSAVFSEHVDALTEQLDRRDSPQWKALAQYYRVDLKGFVGA